MSDGRFGFSKLQASAWLLTVVLVFGLAASAYLANKSYRTFQVLETARVLDIAEAGNIRAWMTLGYVAASYDTPVADLVGLLKLPAETQADTPLRTLAEHMDADPLVFVQRVQQALADISKTLPPPPPGVPDTGWFAQLADDSLTLLLQFGYPVLVLVLFAGALGLPVPAGPLMAVAGTLAMQGELNWMVAGTLALTASVVGDVTSYAAGRLLSQRFLERWGHWVGYTTANRQRLDHLYEHWGGLTLVLTRSLVSYIGAVASILAGAGRYRLDHFLIYSVMGRLLWTASYLGLGYAVGTDFEVASGFLGYLSMLFIAVAVTIGSASLLLRRRHS